MEDLKKSAEGTMFFLSLFQQSFTTIRKENPDLLMEEVIKLMDVWWKGFITLIKGANNGSGD